MHELEVTVDSQRDIILTKEKIAQVKLLELADSKDKELEALHNKLLASERTVSVLQDELERKNQHIVALQNSHSKLKRLLNFKDDLKDLLRTIEEAEDNLMAEEGDTDGLLSSYKFSKDAATNSTNGTLGKKSKKKRAVKSEAKFVPSDIESQNTVIGKEFYL